MPRKFQIFLPVLILIFLNFAACFASDDGFESAQNIDGQNVSVFYYQPLDFISLMQQLNINPADKFLAGNSSGKKAGSPEKEFTDALDTLFLRVCGILDMQLYSLKVNIKLCREDKELKELYSELFDKELQAHSFYVYGTNTIYISPRNFTREILGHEMAHAITSHYFVVQPSVKVAEILSGYAEYQLRRAGQ